MERDENAKVFVRRQDVRKHLMQLPCPCSLAGCLLTTVSVAADKTAPCTAAAATAAP